MSSESNRSKESKTEEPAPSPAATTDAKTKTFDLVQLFDTADENLTKFVNEFSKAQPEYAQAVSNLQQEYIDTAKESIKIGTAVQKQFINSSRTYKNFIMPAITTSPFVQPFVNQSSDFTNNIVRITEINTQLVINALNATRENLKNNRRMAKAATEYSSSIANAWTSSLSSIQNQFTNRR